jgi:hypothetical protein
MIREEKLEGNMARSSISLVRYGVRLRPLIPWDAIALVVRGEVAGRDVLLVVLALVQKHQPRTEHHARGDSTAGDDEGRGEVRLRSLLRICASDGAVRPTAYDMTGACVGTCRHGDLPMPLPSLTRPLPS